MARLHIALFLSAIAVPGFTAGGVFAEEDLLPPPVYLAPWLLLEEPEAYTAETLFDYINGGAEVYLEYGFSLLETCVLSEGRDTCLAEVYRMVSPAAAYGLYSFRRDPEADKGALGAGSLISDYQLSFWLGPHYVVVQPLGGSGERSSILALGKVLAGWLAERSLPGTAGLLPREGLEEEAVLLHGPLALRNRLPLSCGSSLGVSRERPAALAAYERGGGEVLLVVMECRDREDVAAAFARMALCLGEAGADVATHSTAEPLMAAHGGGWVGLAAGDLTLALATGSAEEAVAEILRALTLP